MTVIAHLSDLHFGSEDPRVTAALLGTLNADPVDLVIVSGDLTMAARRAEFERGRAFLAALDAPALAVPGNHDITPFALAERFTAPYRRWRRHVASDLEPTWFRPDAAVVGLNTARRARLKFDWSLGSLSRRQIAGLGARFRPAAKSAFRIVVAHHPFLEDEAAATPQRPQVMVKRARRALEAFHREGVDLVLAGHLHRTYAARFSGPPSASAVVAQDRVRGDQVTVIQAGTALSYRTRGERNSFNRIEIDGPVLSVHTVVWSGSRWDRAEEPLVVLDRRDRSAAAAGVAGLPLGGLPR